MIKWSFFPRFRGGAARGCLAGERAWHERAQPVFSTSVRRLSQFVGARVTHAALAPEYDPSATTAVFGDKSLPQLVFEGVLFKLCSYSSLVRLASATLQGDYPIVSPLARILVRHSIFPHFVAGESMESCLEISRSLNKYASVSTILDHNIEEKETEDAWDLNLKNKLAHLERLRAQQHTVKFIPLKPTALMCPKLLETMTKHLESGGGNDEESCVAALSAEERKRLESGLSRLSEICRVARDGKLGVLLDAEQTYRQPAIEVVAHRLSKLFNCQGDVVVYNTYQCYLQRTAAALKRDIELAKRDNYTLAVKLVRGAYMRTERQRIASMNYSMQDPILKSKAATDASYNSALATLIQQVPKGSVSVLVATHNRQSVDHAVSLMKQQDMENSHPQVHFGSIMGMSDNVSNALGLAGYNSLKLVSFGQFEDVLPWLCRRLDENSDALGAMQGERQLIAQEIWNRIDPRIKG